MAKRHLYTFIVAPNCSARLRKFTVRRSVVIAGVSSLAAAFLFTVAAGIHYTGMFFQWSDYDSLLKANKQLVLENASYRLSAERLSEKLSSLETVSKKLSLLSGFDFDNPQSGSGGTGGIRESRAREGWGRPSRAPLKDLRELTESAGQLELRFKDLEGFYLDQALVHASTPNMMPVKGYPSAGFGGRADPMDGGRDYHVGLDISAPYGNKVVAAADGLVVYAGPRAGYGNVVILNHRFGTQTRYGHLSAFNVLAGQKIKRGDVIGFVGNTGRSTGPHLHYEVRLNGAPVNPLRFIRR
ncbi:MAG: M23 family metallopeptidase [Acidobacteria bacterium]|nr:M23 family metallopeptidase [Acidobacteriota bacterium]